MKAFFRAVLMIIAVFVVIIISLLSLSPNSSIDKNLTVSKLVATQQELLTENNISVDQSVFQDNADIYINDDSSSVVTIFITVMENDAETWAAMNEYKTLAATNNTNMDKKNVEAIVQFGDDKGPLPTEFGFNDITPNALVELRGANSAFDSQKSFKLTLDNSSGAWRGQSIINLNKHLSDETRFRNKLSFDLMKGIPHLVTLRTQFIHLYVKIESPEGQNGFIDYGLFTQVEQPNRRFLDSRLLDSNGQLYKANNFLFNRYPDQIHLVTDPLYSEDAFSQVLEIKGDEDHSKLIRMLDELNNSDIPIENTFEKYFDSENYFTWMAFNILTGNVEAVSQNYFLYSPKNGDKWYFIPWDYDKAFPLQSNAKLATKTYLPWQSGVSNYWYSTLHRRVLENDQYQNKLDKKIDEVLGYLNSDVINAFVQRYQPVTDKYSFAMPDAFHMPVDINISHQIANLLASDVDNNYKLYVESLETPMPFVMEAPIINGDNVDFVWGSSYDLGSRDLTYQFVLGKDWAFKEVLYQKSTKDTNIEVPLNLLAPGKYFWRVTAINSLGKVQYSYNYYTDANSEIHPGIKVFYFTTNNQVFE